jgi:hypothetical protein
MIRIETGQQEELAIVYGIDSDGMNQSVSREIGRSGWN